MRVKLFSRAIVFGAVVCAGPAISAQPVTVGWLERVTLGDDGLVVSAKLDTGADRSRCMRRTSGGASEEDGDWWRLMSLREWSKRAV
jgi:hypothetical protein